MTTLRAHMRLPLAAFVLALAGWAATPQNGSVGRLLDTVRAALRAGISDGEIARTVRQAKLTERLEDAAVEELQSENAGPETLEELDRQRELTGKLAPPAQPPKLFDTPPAPSAAEQAAAIEKTRALALQYTAGLPNFLCTETVSRYVGAKGLQPWKPRDTLKLDVAYSEKGERYKMLEIDGQPTTKTLAGVGGVTQNGEFGSLLQWIFDPDSATQFQWEHWTNLRGRPALVFTYRIDQSHSRYTLNWNSAWKKYHTTSGMRGAVYIDRETAQVMRFSAEADGLPGGFPVLRTPSIVDYDYFAISGQRFLLPRHIDSRVFSKDGNFRNVVEFGNYRKFASDAKVTFDK